MALTAKAERDALRNELVNSLKDILADHGATDVMLYKSNAFCFPVVGAEGGEYFATVTVTIPTGGRDGEAFDGYEMASAYQRHVAEMTAKAEKRAEEKARKAERDHMARMAKSTE